MARQQLRSGIAAATFALLTVGAGAAPAQERSYDSFLSVTPIYQGNADLDRGGEARMTGVATRLGTLTDFGGGTRAGVTLTYDYYDFRSTEPIAFGSVPPWDKVQRYGAAFPVMSRVGDGWVLGVAPAVEWFKENGASSSDALVWGATFSAVRLYPGGNRIGLGLAAFDRIEDTSLVPFLIVDWRFGDRWRLINPLPRGPAGGAGLELDYRFDSGWSLGLGFAFREFRFRLAEDGPVPNGIGEERLVPVFLRATFDMSPSVALHAYAGVSTGGRLRVEDPSGNLLREDDLDNAPLIGLTLIGRF
jgi:hypothetical protein